ncbi:hypothetical protein LSG31_07430 [Fodinisporobacter ferrooxydans]|uniref:Permease n=1 Tax=Fodinisporobacter ferrooxydans TaxID=2901836 RepID=A0ABY4CP68_9BACL|nr:hypothetical protein LSG31_07430 [Alicyclobacillaceae bacterium MYW30-H2]
MNKTTSHSPPFALPMRYITLGVVLFGLFALQLLAESLFHPFQMALMPSVVALTHLLTLGVLLSIVTGAVYQLTTVTFLIPIRNVGLAGKNFWIYGMGIVGLWISMEQWWTVGLLIFGTIVTISIYIFGILVMLSLSKSTVKGMIRWYIWFSMMYLLLAVAFAWTMIASIQFGIGSRFYMELLETHIVLATIGFFTCLIIGFSLKLFPMFTLAHGFSTARQPYTFGLLQGGLALLIMGIWLHSRILLTIGGVAAVAAFVNHALDLRGMIQKRMRKTMETPIRYVVVATIFGLISFCAVLGIALAHGGLTQWQGIIGFYILGWIVLTVMGYAYKIIPFLIWNQRYGTKAGKEKVPMMSELFDLKKSRWVFGLFVAGLFLFSCGMVLGWYGLTMAGGSLLTIGIGLFVWQMLQILKPSQLWKEIYSND